MPNPFKIRWLFDRVLIFFSLVGRALKTQSNKKVIQVYLMQFKTSVFHHVTPSPDLARNYIFKAIEDFFRVYIASSENEWGWENSRQFCKPETQSRVCMTFENSLNSPNV